METKSELEMGEEFFARPNHARVLRMTRELFGRSCMTAADPPAAAPRDGQGIFLDPEVLAVELGPWQPLHADMAVHRWLTSALTEATGASATLYLRPDREEMPCV